MSQKILGVKGMNDLLPEQAELWDYIERTARAVFGRHAYREIRTPILEDTALFVRGVGEGTDIVGKEMYTFEDKAGRSLSLRPELTASSVRAYLEHSVGNQDPVTRWFYAGPCFRYERMKTGRYRQFWQIGAEAYGVEAPAQDVEVLEMLVRFFQTLGLEGVSLNVNSIGDAACRPQYREALVAYFRGHEEALCGDCRSRLERNPLRVLDCKNPGCQSVAKDAPNILEYLCQPCRVHFDEVKRGLSVLGIPYQVNPRLVRGLDYYTRTAFEAIVQSPALGTASTVSGGGRYDGLIESLGGAATPAIGFAIGVDRVALLLGEKGTVPRKSVDLFLVSMDAAARDEAMKLASSLRREGFAVETDTRGGSLKSQMKRADRSGARYAVVLGEQELKERRAKLKPMAGGEPKEASLDALAVALREVAVH